MYDYFSNIVLFFLLFLVVRLGIITDENRKTLRIKNMYFFVRLEAEKNKNILRTF